MTKAHPLILSLVLAAASGCSTAGNAPGGGLGVPYITDPVSGSSSALLGPAAGLSDGGPSTLATTGAKLNGQSCSICGSNPMMNVWSLASIFAIQGKEADVNSCMISAVSEAGVVPGLTSGVNKYITTPTGNMRVNITESGGVVTTFALNFCMGTSNTQYISGTNTNGAVTFKLRISEPTSSIFVSMDAAGTLSGTTWTSKTLTVGFSIPSSGNYSSFSFTQLADYLDITGSIDSGTLGTLDANDVRLVSRAQLVGNSLQTYALGDGSIRVATGTNAATNTNWNGDTGVHGSGPTTYDSVVASATLPSLPTTRVTAFTSSEQWNCVPEGTPVDLMAAAGSNPSFMAAVQACQALFQ